MSSAVLLPTIYRSLLRLGRQLDANPFSKALLLAQPSLLFDRRSREVIPLPGASCCPDDRAHRQEPTA